MADKNWNTIQEITRGDKEGRLKLNSNFTIIDTAEKNHAERIITLEGKLPTLQSNLSESAAIELGQYAKHPFSLIDFHAGDKTDRDFDARIIVRKDSESLKDGMGVFSFHAYSSEFYSQSIGIVSSWVYPTLALYASSSPNPLIEIIGDGMAMSLSLRIRPQHATNPQHYIDYYMQADKFVCTSSSSLGSSDYRWKDAFLVNAPSTTSDRNEKEHILPISENIKKTILEVPTASYTMKKGTSGRTHCGIIAQDLEQAMKENGVENKDFAALMIDEVDGKDSYSLRYEELIAPMLAIIQDQEKRIKELEKRLGGDTIGSDSK